MACTKFAILRPFPSLIKGRSTRLTWDPCNFLTCVYATSIEPPWSTQRRSDTNGGSSVNRWLPHGARDMSLSCYVSLDVDFHFEAVMKSGRRDGPSDSCPTLWSSTITQKCCTTYLFSLSFHSTLFRWVFEGAVLPLRAWLALEWKVIFSRWDKV